MKKLIFISLLVIPFCKAADPKAHASWYQALQDIPNKFNLHKKTELFLGDKGIEAIPDNLNSHYLEHLYLGNNYLQEIPDNLNFPRLTVLSLIGNHIRQINPQIFKKFPNLQFLYLNKNPLTQENVDELRKAAVQAGARGDAYAQGPIEISADDIGDQYLPEGLDIKGD